MWLLLVGAAIGVVVVALLRTLTNYEAASTAGLRDHVSSLDSVVSELTERIESLEAIAVAEAGLPDQPDLELESMEGGQQRKVNIGS